MRIRFRASDFGQVAKDKSRSYKSKGASCAEMVLLGSFICSRVIQQLGCWTHKIQANVDYWYAPSALRSALHSSIRACADLVQSGREETCRGASRGIFFKHSSEPMLLCVISYDT